MLCQNVVIVFRTTFLDFVFRYFTSGCMKENMWEANTANEKRVTRGEGQGAVWNSQCWESSTGVPALDVYLDMTHLSSFHSGLFNQCQNTWRESDSR